MKFSDVKVGMKVKIVRSFPSHGTDEEGHYWDNSWNSEMNDFVGEESVFTVTGVSPSGITLNEIWKFRWPWVSLEPVEVPLTEQTCEVGMKVRVAHKTDFSWIPAGMDKHVGKIGTVILAELHVGTQGDKAVLLSLANGDTYFFLMSSLTIPVGADIPKPVKDIDKEIAPVFTLTDGGDLPSIELKKVWVASGLNQIYTSNQWKFALLSSTHQMATPWVMCRDFLADCFAAHLSDQKGVSIYGLQIDPSKGVPVPDMKKLRMAITHDKSKSFDKLAIAKHFIHLFEGSMRVLKTKVYLGTYQIDEHHGKNKCYVTESSRFWISSPALISLYSLLWRCGDNFTVEEASNIKTTAQFLAAMNRCKVNNKNTGYFQQLMQKDNGENFLRILRGHRVIFKDYPLTRTYNVTSHWKGDTYNYHNHHGIIGLMFGRYPDKEFNQKHSLTA